MAKVAADLGISEQTIHTSRRQARIDGSEPIAAAFDAANGGSSYRAALTDARAALGDPERVSSDGMVREIAERHASSCVQFAKTQSLRHRDVLLGSPFAPDVQLRYVRLADESLATQHSTEAADEVPFETCRQQ